MTVDALCKGEDCTRGATGATLRHRALPGLRLCVVCRERLSVRLDTLPALYEECADVLGGGAPAGLRERTTGGSLPGMPFNAAAAESRTEIAATLASWSGLVAEERGLTAPRRAVPPMAAFLRAHADWLAAHPAAEDATREVARLVRTARRLTRRDTQRRVVIGPCVKTGCPGELTAHLSGRPSAPPGEIRCGADAGHTWPGHLWTELNRAMRGSVPSALSLPATPSPAERWLTAAQISRLWQTPIGTVYRLAGEHEWRRHRRAGRTHYLEADVHDCFSRRAAGPA